MTLSSLRMAAVGAAGAALLAGVVACSSEAAAAPDHTAFEQCLSDHGVPAPPAGGPGGPGRASQRTTAIGAARSRRAAGPTGNRSEHLGRRTAGLPIAGSRTADPLTGPDMEQPPSRSSWLDQPRARGPGGCLGFASARRMHDAHVRKSQELRHTPGAAS